MIADASQSPAGCAMNLTELNELLRTIERQAEAAVRDAGTADGLRAAESRLVKGPLADVLKSIKAFAPDQRGAAGQAINTAKNAVKDRFQAALGALRDADVAGERKKTAGFDPTLPPPLSRCGSLHPVTIVQREVERLFTGLGFAVVGGPEMETDYYNFEALNIPEMHPARDTQDTFWLTNGWLLRTHTSPCQVRAMKKWGPPLRVIAPGRCFRYEAVDASHDNTFFQVEGLLIDKHISIAHLIAFMKLLLREVFHREVKVRLRPGYFPFVEPGFEMDMSCEICDGAGCATCRKSGWIEILPCGMVHPNVLRHGNIDPGEYTGFAFGLGLTRLAMMKFGIADIRTLNGGDIRGLVNPDTLSGQAMSA
jgi:phenylalanyl-tRNA synthetase alpha chain